MNRQIFRKGTKVSLVLLEKDDAPLLASFINDESVSRWLARTFPMYVSEEVEWLEALHKKKETGLVWGLMLNDTETLVGTMGLHNIDWIHRTATTGALIKAHEHRGRGIGTEAKMLLLEYAFNRLNLRQIHSFVFADNTASLRYSAKCGYVEVGRLPDAFLRNGECVDEVVLRVTRELWQNAQAVQTK